MVQEHKESKERDERRGEMREGVDLKPLGL